MQEEAPKLTTASGRPYVENDNTMTVGPRGPILLQDYILHEKMAHFNRERIPERVVHAKGAGAYGTFTVTHEVIVIHTGEAVQSDWQADTGVCALLHRRWGEGECRHRA